MGRHFIWVKLVQEEHRSWAPEERGRSTLPRPFQSAGVKKLYLRESLIRE